MLCRSVGRRHCQPEREQLADGIRLDLALKDVAQVVGAAQMCIRDSTYASVAIAQVQDQEWKTVWPFEFASSKIQEVTLG